ncbi:efflux RND transporter periplasmic adaptor subunit [Hymenobacter sp. YC55]|uniref:efflux RND transporter periplasmic adaptor subunit n=1 Tax=Hymenobacter sp. YC55 TaxID=3034019 RepID=UPI0023F8BADD|nr:efflux RND transporter periplasmic adaptor subunit [Hymenobacter sp. YC55]MDF7810017.1 efflux RND transporter periplasmic adaptor subunit [Hymenobacter sp. YC55]
MALQPDDIITSQPANNHSAPPAASGHPAADDAAANKSSGKRRFWVVILLIALVFGGLFLLGLLPRLKANKAREQETTAAANATPVVSMQAAQAAPDTVRVELPANTVSNHETYLFARTNGFVQAWYVDIGTRVKRGQLLARIATPELDQQVVEARTSLALTRTSYDRLRSVDMPGAISKQELDEAQARYNGQQAAVQQLLALRNFREVRAPFSGIVTQRNVEVGALVSTSNAEGTQLFKVEQTDTLRAFVNVPQNYATGIKAGLVAELIVPEFTNRTFRGRVSREAGALSSDTRTLLTVVKIPNRRQELRPGVFGQIRFELPRTSPSVIIPANSLVPGGTDTRVVVIKDKKVHYQPVVAGRDFGAQVEVLEGLKGGEMLVINPAETLQENETVEVRKAPAAKKPDTPAAPKGPERLYDPDRPHISSPVGEGTGK